MCFPDAADPSIRGHDRQGRAGGSKFHTAIWHWSLRRVAKDLTGACVAAWVCFERLLVTHGSVAERLLVTADATACGLDEHCSGRCRGLV